MKEFFTTGEIAKMCGVCIATVIKWIESGRLDGYKVPISGHGWAHRRIPRESLKLFLEKEGLPFMVEE